jgi:hypothetical protein
VAEAIAVAGTRRSREMTQVVVTALTFVAIIVAGAVLQEIHLIPRWATVVMIASGFVLLVAYGRVLLEALGLVE